MPTSGKWQFNRSTHGFLVSVDISGFSKAEAPDGLLDHRMDLFQAVEATALFPKASEGGDVRVSFLGDEIRLAFHSDLGPEHVREFVMEVLANLRATNRFKHTEYQTWVRGAILEGAMTLRQWHHCEYLDSPLVFQAQDMMGHLQPGEVAVNNTFRDSLRNVGIPVGSLQQRAIGEHNGYVFITEV